MAKQNKRSGGKFAGSHTTFIDGIALVVDYIAKMKRVQKLSLSKIDMLTRSSSSGISVKCTDLGSQFGSACVKVRIAFGCGAQDIYVYLVHPSTRRNFRRRLNHFVESLK